MCGAHYWSTQRDGCLRYNGEHEHMQWKFFDIFNGVSLSYYPGMPPNQILLNINDRQLQIAGGAALAIHIQGRFAKCSSFPCSKSNTWANWCTHATVAHARVVQKIAFAYSVPFRNPEVAGPWWMPISGGLPVYLNADGDFVQFEYTDVVVSDCAVTVFIKEC